MIDLLSRFLNTLERFYYEDTPDYDNGSYKEFIQIIADGSADGMEFKNGIITMQDKENILIWNILDYTCIYNGEKFKLHYCQPYTDPVFINGLIV